MEEIKWNQEVEVRRWYTGMRLFHCVAKKTPIVGPIRNV